MLESLPHIIRENSIKVFYFSRFFLRHFHASRGMQTASSLAYTTLLSIVPLIAVMFGLFGKISIFKDASASIQAFIFANFVPHFGETIQGYISGFSMNASKLTITGSLALIMIAIMLMATIDNTFNRIWFVTKKRHPVSRLLVYWAVLTMGPLLIGIGLASTSYLLSLPVVADVDNTLNIRAHLLSWLPFLTTSTAFTLLYILIPNCFVPKKDALIGGVICASLFEFAKYGFGVYVTAMPSYENIYGTLSIIPLFLIWIYVSWVVVLFGAHISFCLSSFQFQNEIKENKVSWSFTDVLRVLAILYKAQQSGQTVTISMLETESIRLPNYQIHDLLEYLQRAKWVNQISNSQWLLSKDMAEINLFELHKVLPVRFPLSDQEIGNDELAEKLKRVLGDHWQQLEKQFSISIADFFKGKK